jgi:cadmium resistance protein CadD (predicted permease)
MKFTSGPSSAEVGNDEHKPCNNDELDHQKTFVSCVKNLTQINYGSDVMHILTGYFRTVMGAGHHIIIHIILQTVIRFCTYVCDVSSAKSWKHA